MPRPELSTIFPDQNYVENSDHMQHAKGSEHRGQARQAECILSKQGITVNQFTYPVVRFVMSRWHVLQNKRRSRVNSDRDDGDKVDDPVDTLKNATTLYVGNLYVERFLVIKYDLPRAWDWSGLSSFYTTEEQIHELFAK
jgi:hypothetical protein